MLLLNLLTTASAAQEPEAIPPVRDAERDGELQEVYVQSDPNDGRLVTEVLHVPGGPSGVQVFVVLADGSVETWPASEAAPSFLPALSSAAREAAAGTARLIESPRSRRLAVLRYRDPEDADGMQRLTLFPALAGDDLELEIPPRDYATIHLSDGSPTLAVLRRMHGPETPSFRFDVYATRGGQGRKSPPELPTAALLLSHDGALVVAATGRALLLFDAERPTRPLGEPRSYYTGFALSPDGRRVALLQRDRVDVHDRQGLVWSFAVDGIPQDADFGPGGELAVIDEDSLYLLPAGGEAPLWRLDLTEEERSAGLRYRSVVVGFGPVDRLEGAGELVVAAGRLAVERKNVRGGPVGLATASVVALRRDGKPLDGSPVLGELTTHHFGGASPRVDVFPSGGAWTVFARTSDAVVLWSRP